MQKNRVVLSQNEVAKIQDILGDNYTIGDSYGICGAHCISVGIRDLSGTKYVLKRPIKDTDEWIKFQLARHKNVSEIFSIAHSESGVDFEVIESYGRQYYIAKHLGDPLGKCIENFDLASQKKIANQLAKFLSSIHKKGSVQSKPFKSYEYPSLYAIRNYFSAFLSQDEKILIMEVAEKIKLYRNSAFPTVFIHGDFRSDNILYCKETGTISVIDFECSGFSNILREFALDALSSLGFPYSFWFMVIDAYNHMGNTLITPDIVRTLMVASLIHEYGRCAIAARATDLELHKRCQYMKNRLKSLFEEFR